jgi:hypothetical protein
MRNDYKILVGKYEGTMCRWEDNIKRVCECVYRIIQMT